MLVTRKLIRRRTVGVDRRERPLRSSGEAGEEFRSSITLFRRPAQDQRRVFITRLACRAVYA